MTDKLVARLSHVDACAVSDAMTRLGLEGTVAGITPMTVVTRIAGRVLTVRLGPVGEKTPERHLCTAAVEAGGPGDVIVVEHHSRADAAGWGGILSTAAAVRGIEGTIVDGPACDIDEARELGYPVFARGAVPFTARGRVVEHAWNEPVEIGGVAVAPGDLVIADSSGIVFVPAARATEIVGAAESIAAREAGMADLVRAGKKVSEVMGGGYEQMLEKKA